MPIVYKAKVHVKGQTDKFYFGLSETAFKARWRNHKTTFTHSRYRNSTELSSYIWKLRDDGIPDSDVEISWSIYQKSRKYQCGTRSCDLCLSEKLAISSANKSSLLNKRTELATACVHRSKFFYTRVKGNHKVRKKPCV